MGTLCAAVDFEMKPLEAHDLDRRGDRAIEVEENTALHRQARGHIGPRFPEIYHSMHSRLLS